MQQFKFLESLVEFEPTGSSFLSIYLNTEPNETGKKDFDVFLRKQFSEHGAVLDADTAEKESFDADEKKTNEFLNTLDPSVRGVAIFASSDSNGLFKQFTFQVPFEENAFFREDRPFVSPLLKIFSKNPPFVVVAADTNHADIYLFRRGKTIDVDQVQNIKTNRSEVGGWSQMRYQRHIDNFHQQHAKEVVQELSKLVRDENIEHIILCGDETVIIPMLKSELSKELEEKLVATLSLNVETPEHEIHEEAKKALDEFEAKADKEKIELVLDQNYDEGRGVVGLEKTLEALMNGQVQELYVLSDFDQINYDRGTVRTILHAYKPGEDTDLPDAAERELLLDEVLKKGAQTADHIRFIDNADLLQTHGGIAALLRYQVKGANQ
jgi:peptide chain release factor subunit 1